MAGMRRPARRLLPFVLAAFGLAIGGGSLRGAARAAAAASEAPDAAAALAAQLDDDRYDVRRAAERALERLGERILRGGTPTAEETAWAAALDAAADLGGSPAAAVRRILRRLEAQADDDEVGRMPRLLRTRLERTLPQLVLARRRGGEVGAFQGFNEAAFVAEAAASAIGRGVRGLLPDARPTLLAIVARSPDARVVAGAVVALCGEEGEPPDGDDVVAALLDGYDRSPETMRRLGAWRGPGGLEPVAAIALALAVSGRGADLARLRATAGVGDADVTFDGWLRQYVKAHGRGELAAGTFLVQVEEGTADADVELEATRRALAADVPWLARLLARRALFLRPDDATARGLLAQAYERVAMRATARDLRGDTPDPEVGDDPVAVDLDAALREGRLSSRILFSRELGETPVPGLAPVAIRGDRVVFGTAEGAVGVAEATTGNDRSTAPTGKARLPLAVVVADRQVGVLTGRGDLLVFELDDDAGLTVRARHDGPFLAAVAGDGGDLWLVANGRKVYRRPRDGAPTLVAKVPSVSPYVPRSLARTTDGVLVLRNDRGEVVAIDPADGAVTTLARPEQGVRAVATFGREVLLAEPDGWRRVRPDGTEVVRVPRDDAGDAVGIGGDAATGTVVVVAPDLTSCFSPDGVLRWQEQIGGSGNPTVQGDYVVVPAGTGGRPLGDGREDRTIYVLRAGGATVDPFAIEARVRVVDAAVTAVVEDRDAVAVALLDPLRGWFTSTESWGAENALREAQRQREARRAPPPAPRADPDR